MSNPFKKEESTASHNVRQLLGCAPVLGSLAVGVLGLVSFGIGVNHLGDRQPGWLIGGSVGLIASGIGFGVLGWLVWSRRE